MMSDETKQEFERPDTPLSESAIPKLKEGTKDEVIADLRAMAEDDPERVISRNYYRVNGRFAESAWNQYFGTFAEFKRQAGIVLTRQQHAQERYIAKHASVDHYRKLSEERQHWGDKYLYASSDGRWKMVMVLTDLHDEMCDPFYLEVVVDTARRAQPDVIVFGGDLFDSPEFGKYSVDPRDWGPIRRIRAAHEIIRRLREVCPNAQMDLVEGNHEARLLKHMADETPALRVVLADLHGFTLQKLFGLDKFEVNYIARCDLGAWNKSDERKEIAKNYAVYFNSFLVHHFPEGRAMALPGVNGHHHRHIVWSEYNPLYGAYEWHQLGCGHIRDAEYCDGLKWHNGFALAHIDTSTHQVALEYIDVRDFAVVGGKLYRRDELITQH